VARAGLGADQNLAAAKLMTGRAAPGRPGHPGTGSGLDECLVRHSARQGHNRLTFRPIPSVLPRWRPTGSYAESYAEQGRYAGLRAT
jgi:hypothetical protein